MRHVDTIERLLCERYNVRSLDGLGALPGAIEAARGGDLTPLRAALEGRELYRWGPAIADAVAAAEAGDDEPEPAAEAKPRRQARGKKDAPAEQEPPIEPVSEEPTGVTPDGEAATGETPKGESATE